MFFTKLQALLNYHEETQLNLVWRIFLIFHTIGTSVTIAIGPMWIGPKGKSPIVKNYLELISNDNNKSKFHISPNLGLEIMKSRSLNVTRWKFSTNTKNAPRFLKEKVLSYWLFWRKLFNIQSILQV
jgi:hypothetical protein